MIDWAIPHLHSVYSNAQGTQGWLSSEKALAQTLQETLEEES